MSLPLKNDDAVVDFGPDFFGALPPDVFLLVVMVLPLKDDGIDAVVTFGYSKRVGFDESPFAFLFSILLESCFRFVNELILSLILLSASGILKKGLDFGAEASFVVRAVFFGEIDVLTPGKLGLGKQSASSLSSSNPKQFTKSFENGFVVLA